MKKMGLVLFAVMMTVFMGLGAAFGAECYTLTGGDWFEGDMALSLTTQGSGGTGDVLPVTGKGTDSKGNTALITGTTQSSGHIKEYALKGSGSIKEDNSVTAFYEYHLTLGPGGSGYTGTYNGEIHTSDGAEKNVSGAANQVDCP